MLTLLRVPVASQRKHSLVMKTAASSSEEEKKKKISEITRRKRAKKCRQINVNIYFMTPLRTLSCDMRGELKVREEEEGGKKPL